ncbi:MAG TPA: enoyl-CoA hydratase/isomerase family protein [Chloroflexota bacterium]|jgi:enoyl-CoA hydratase/carnithine racemase|nr:enoyl-CoA hydratase/isomerase family protein [Chloroflexota bacterium]
MSDVVLVERRGRVGLVTLNRPAKLNALSSTLVNELEHALHELDADDAIGAIVITGAGERAFSAGGDMAEQIAALDAEQAFPRVHASSVVRAVKTPTLAAIRGYCFGGGALLTLECDIRIGGDDTRFKFPGANYGRAPGGALLPRIVGDAKARELLLTGDEVSAAEAWRIGLLNQVVPAADVVETTVAMAARIAANNSEAVRALKEIIDQALPTDRALAHEREVTHGMGHSADASTRFRSAAERVIGGPGQVRG